MKTITFYSYKGGVGRTLALINIAKQLAEFGKKVCLIDFDLEAPGLIHKYEGQITKPIEIGIVDYIYDFAINDVVNESISDFSNTVSLSNSSKEITLISAGNSDDPNYWKKLSRINWWDMFYKENSEGISFFLDLKEKIEKEIKPDYLLIDTRTGISEIAGITMNILADSIVILAVNNEENLCGSKHTIDAILDDNNNILDNERDIHFVLSRIPLGENPTERIQEKELVEMIKKRINYTEKAECKISSFNILHSDRKLELNEMNSIGGLGSSFSQNEKDNEQKIKPDTISDEYLTLFNSLIKEDVFGDDKIKLNSLEQISNLIARAQENFSNPDSSKFIKIIEQIREIEPNNIMAYYLEGCHLNVRGETDKAIEILTQGIKYGDNMGHCLLALGVLYYADGNYKEALNRFKDYIEKGFLIAKLDAIFWEFACRSRLYKDKESLLPDLNKTIEMYPTLIGLLNLRSNIYNILRKYDKALIDIYKAIDLDPKESIFYATLAEIKFCMGDFPEFYRNIKIALDKKYNFVNIFKESEFVCSIYKEAAKNPEFIKILEIYKQFDAIAIMEKGGWIQA